jgi:excisionase family DNA binding protein
MGNPRQNGLTPAEVRDQEILTPEELALLLRCGRTLSYQLLAKGIIPSFKLGKLRRIRRADVDSFVEACLRETKQ